MTVLNKLKLLIGILISLNSLQCYSQTYINGGEVNGKWEKQYSPYIINDHITIKKDEQLIIEPGVIIKFNMRNQMEVLGSLIANGDKNDSIIFTRNTAERWHGIRFNNEDPEQDSSILKYCTIEYSKSPYKTIQGGGISIKAPRVLISNCIIQYNTAHEGGGMASHTSAKVINTKIINNEADNRAGGIYVDGPTDFTGCVIAHNRASNQAAFIAYDFPLFKNCTISDNESYGNYPYLYCFSGNYKLYNSIIYYNTPLPNNAYIGSNELPEFRYCNIQGGISSIFPVHSVISGFFNGVFDNCFDVEPGFKDWENGDFSLENSHCIDAGDPDTEIYDFEKDIDGNDRIFKSDLSRIDLGAYEYSQFIANQTPFIIPQDTIFLFKNRTRKINFSFFRGDMSKEYDIKLYSDNDNVQIVLDTISDNSFSVLATPTIGWTGEVNLIKQIGNEKGTNELFVDTTTLVVSNYFKGVISDTLVFYDTVKIIGDVFISRQGKLSIEPGTYVEFQGSYQISVLGEMNVFGKNDSIVKFNAIDTAVMDIYGRSFEQGWGGIRFFGSKKNQSTFQYCNFRNIGVPKYLEGVYGEYPADHTLRYNAIGIINYDNINFEHCIFESNFNPNVESQFEIQQEIYKYQSVSSALVIHLSKNINVNDCVFRNSFISEGGATCIYAHSSTVEVNRCLFKDINYQIFGNSIGNSHCIKTINSNISIKYSNFTNNEVGRSVIASYSDNYLKIENCNFYNNNKVLELKTNEATVVNNQFINNGMAINARSKINVVGNLIAYSKVFCGCSNFFGTAINLGNISGNSLIANNTIVNNEQDSHGAAIYYSYSSPTIVNNIFWQNSREANIDGYNGAGLNIDDPVISNNFLNGDPLFIQGDTLDFRLTDKSPCINNANKELVGELLPHKDIVGNNRIDNLTGILDQGAYEYIAEIENLEINQVAPANNENDVDIKSPIYITFNAPIKIVNQELIILSNKNDTKIIELSEDKYVLIIKPQGFWDFNTTQILKIAEGAICYIEKETVLNKNFESLFYTWSCTRASLTIETNNLNYCPNTDIILTANSTGDSMEDYLWYFENNEASISDSSTYHILGFNHYKEGIYRCQITDLCGNTIKESITVSLNEDISYPAIQKKWGDVYFINDDKDYYSNHRWYFDYNEIAQDSPNVLIPSTGMGKLFVTVKDLKSGCVLNSDTLNVQSEKNNIAYFAYPNPLKNNDILNVVIQTQYNRGVFKIYSMKGQELERKDLYQSNILSNKITDFNPGIYLVNIILDNKSSAFKIVIE